MSVPAPFTIARDLAAPVELVFAVHTSGAHLSHWMKPAGFDVIKSELDLRPGGVHHYGQRAANGLTMWGKQTYVEIEPPTKLVLIQQFSDEHGGVTRHPMAATWPERMLATTTFEDRGGGRTRMTISWLPYESDEAGHATFDAARPQMAQGFEGMLVALEEYLAKLQAG